MPFDLPNDFFNETPANAVPVDGNYKAIENYINNNVINADGSVTMTAPLGLWQDPTQPTHAATKSYVDAVLPIGIIMPYGGQVAPAGSWLRCDGQTVNVTDYPKLWNVIQYRYGGALGGPTFQVPKLDMRFPVGLDTATTPNANFSPTGKSGGTFTVPVPRHQHPMPHTHDIDHNHGNINTSGHSVNHTHAFSDTTSTTSAAGAHAHDVDASNIPTALSNGRLARSSGGTATTYPTDTEPDHTHTVSVSGTTAGANVSHTHQVDIPLSAGFVSGAVSTPNTDFSGVASVTMYQPYVVVTYIIRAD